MIRLVALDIDGTLLDSSNRLSDGNAAAVREALAQGAQVVLATSRWFHLARLTAASLGLTTPLICHNGALVKRPQDGAGAPPFAPRLGLRTAGGRDGRPAALHDVHHR